MTTETIEDITAATDFSEFPSEQQIDFTEKDRSKPVIDVGMMTKVAVTWGKAIHQSQKFGAANEAQGFLLALECLKKGITPNDWLERYHVIKGKKSMSAEAMRAAFRAAGGDIKWEKLGDDGKEAKAKFCPPDGGTKLDANFTIEDAKRLRVSFDAESNWSKDPGAMLRARLTSKALRICWPEGLGGCYLPEETAEFVGSVESTPVSTPVPQATAPVAEKTAATVVTTTKPTPSPPPQKPAEPPKQMTDDELVAAIKNAARLAKLEPAYVKSRVTGMGAANIASLSRDNKEWLLADFEVKVKTEEARQDFMNKLDNAGITGKGDDNTPPFEVAPEATESAPKN